MRPPKGDPRNKIYGRSGAQHHQYGKPRTEEEKEKTRLKQLGRKQPQTTGPNHPNYGKHLPVSTRRKMSVALRGANAPQWKGGVTPINALVRESLDYRLWREAIFKRDNYTCQGCGDRQGGNLQADHIKSFALYPELRFALDNGRTLCIPCHEKTPTYGFKKEHQPGFNRVKGGTPKK